MSNQKKLNKSETIKEIRNAIGIPRYNLEKYPLKPNEATLAIILLAMYLQSWSLSPIALGDSMTWRNYLYENVKRLEESGLIEQVEDNPGIIILPRAQAIAESLKNMVFDMLGVDRDKERE